MITVQSNTFLGRFLIKFTVFYHLNVETKPPKMLWKLYLCGKPHMWPFMGAYKFLFFHDVVLKVHLSCEADTERAVGLLKQYQANLTSPEEQALKTSVGKVSAILGSHLFQALLGKKNKTDQLLLKQKMILWQSTSFILNNGFPLWCGLFQCILRVFLHIWGRLGV